MTFLCLIGLADLEEHGMQINVSSLLLSIIFYHNRARRLTLYQIQVAA